MRERVCGLLFYFGVNMFFRNLVFSAVTAGLVAGFVLGLMQLFLVTPTILAAEMFEVAEVPAVSASQHSHGEASDSQGVGHHHGDTGAWAPEDGAERTFSTFTSNILTGIGFALLLSSIMAFSGKASIKNSWLWGAAGFVVFFAAPSLGLTPEIPGAEAANLQDRQGWWLTTVLLTGLGLGVIAFAQPILKMAGIILLLIPHILGAPLPEHHGFSHPDPAAVQQLTALADAFVQQTAIANGVFWLVLGVVCVLAMKQFGLIGTTEKAA